MTETYCNTDRNFFHINNCFINWLYWQSNITG